MSGTEKERWDARYREGAGSTQPSSFLLSLDELLPRTGRALDLAGGRGRHGIWIARRGLDVSVADVSAVGLALANDAAREAGIRIHTVAVDLEAEPAPQGPWDLIVCFHYLNRALFHEFPRLLAPDGLLVFCQPTMSNLERHERPGAAHLLEDGELPALVEGLEILIYQEGWLEEGRHEARMVARRQQAPLAASLPPTTPLPATASKP